MAGNITNGDDVCVLRITTDDAVRTRSVMIMMGGKRKGI